ncbi:AP-5 complex subunit beta-1-like [Pomacea canaliculata]|uniref:AP-5 complex subunit beta-1-like n=1 Tax=Pomacea canaliculata TaxID=400727 RepID=UPI000D737B1D|nr:AP-5 complex subunit beta-1-like [Pomacea canaliculata]
MDDNQIFAITFEVDVGTEVFEEMKKFYLLSLSKSEKVDLAIQLVPKLPKPCELRTNAVFFTENYNTVSCPMVPLQLTFIDLALPVPWEQLGVTSVQEKHLVFDALWKRFTTATKIADGIESLQVVKCIRSKLRETWGSFHLPDLNGQQVVTDKFIFFLPPSFHLVFKVYTENQNENINMATDFWKILPNVSAYLTSLSD